MYDYYSAQYKPTVGVDFHSKVLNIDGVDFNVSFWDIVGADKAGSVAKVNFASFFEIKVFFRPLISICFAAAGDIGNESFAAIFRLLPRILHVFQLLINCFPIVYQLFSACFPPVFHVFFTRFSRVVAGILQEGYRRFVSL